MCDSIEVVKNVSEGQRFTENGCFLTFFFSGGGCGGWEGEKQLKGHWTTSQIPRFCSKKLRFSYH